MGDALTFDTKTEGLRLLLFVANTSQAEDEASDDCAVVLGSGDRKSTRLNSSHG